jgi:hypothetical protein
MIYLIVENMHGYSILFLKNMTKFNLNNKMLLDLCHQLVKINEKVRRVSKVSRVREVKEVEVVVKES